MFKHIIFKVRLLVLKLNSILLLPIRFILLLFSIASLLLIIYEFGFILDETTSGSIQNLYRWILLIFFIATTLRLLFRFKEMNREKGRWIDWILYIGLFLNIFVSILFPNYLPDGLSFLKIFISPAITYALLIIFSILQISARIFELLNKIVAPGLLFAYSFIFIILVGTGLLLLPRSTELPISLIDSLFTATSAVCVTGLTVVDVSTTFTPLGKGILVMLIQIGGIGVMTFTSFFALSFMGQSSFHNNLILKDLLNEDNLNAIFRTLFNIVLTTLAIELVGAVIIYYSISGTMELDIGEEIFFSVFHAISAFCNAGFSTLHGNLYDPLVSTNYRLQAVVAILIIFGGLGFPILFNYSKLIGYYIRNIWLQVLGLQKQHVYTRIIYLNTRISVITTILLLVVGTGLFFILEKNNTLDDLSWTGKIIGSLFGAVTPRTAGFNTVNLTAMLPATVMLTIVLMWIGASPMSTGGGIKTTTFAIACMNIINMARGKDKMEVSRREINRFTIQRAFAVIGLSILWLIISVFCVAVAEPQAELTAIIFECVSALSTVGSTLNLTPTLSTFSRVIIIITMFIGRVGALTILSGILHQHIDNKCSYPQESIMVG